MKVFNFLWNRLGWAIVFVVCGIISFKSFIWLVEAYEIPILSKGVYWMIIKYPALILWFALSLGLGGISIAGLVGFFKPSWDDDEPTTDIPELKKEDDILFKDVFKEKMNQVNNLDIDEPSGVRKRSLIKRELIKEQELIKKRIKQTSNKSKEPFKIFVDDGEYLVFTDEKTGEKKSFFISNNKVKDKKNQSD